MPQFFDYLPDSVVFYLSFIPHVWYFYALNGVFAVFCLACLYMIYYSFRRASGHEKFKGNWYRPAQLQALKQELFDGIKDGRLPDSETMAFLDRHIYGKEREMRKINGNGWL